MAKKNLVTPPQGGTPVERASRLSYEQLFLYLAVFFIGGVVMALGLATGALSSEGENMVILGGASVCLCIVATVLFGSALLRKRNQGSRKLSK